MIPNTKIMVVRILCNEIVCLTQCPVALLFVVSGFVLSQNHVRSDIGDIPLSQWMSSRHLVVTFYISWRKDVFVP